MTDDICFLRPIEGKTMVDLVKKSEILRLSVRWPLKIETGNGQAEGETRNITGEGIFVYCSEKLHEGVVYPLEIKLPENRVEMSGKVTWSNLDNCTSLNFNLAMGFYFLRVDEYKDKQILRAAIVAECRKPSRLRQEADRHTDLPPSSEAQVIAHFARTVRNTV